LTEEKRLLEKALASMNKDTGEEKGDNMSSDFSNIYQSIDADRSEVMQKMEKALQKRLNLDNLVWQYEARQFIKAVEVLEAIPFVKLRILTPTDFVEEVYCQTSEEVPTDEFWFVKHFKKNLLAKLESYLE